VKATLDAAGPLLVPKAIRLALGLKAGQEVELHVVEGRLEIEVAATSMRLRKRGEGKVAVAHKELPPLSAELVRESLERLRR
jgi:AbrB family looped-hinge helix DNA binding protein